MRNLRRARMLFTAVLTTALLCGCIVTKDSPAPGCVETIGFPAMGGCEGKTAILDITVEPPSDCLTIEANNCNGGTLRIRNNCTATFTVSGIEVAPDSSQGFDVSESTPGTFELVEVSSNFSKFAPEADQAVEFLSQLGETPMRISFTKTMPLCK